MKKKIINGIMMVALVAATSTSFVSCKDTNEDVRVEQAIEIAGLQGRLTTLENQYGDLDGRVSAMKNRLDDVQALAEQNRDDIDVLQLNVDAIEEEIGQLELWLIETFAKVRELKRELLELHQETDKEVQKTKMQHFGEVLSDIVMPDLQTQETESSLEINFFIGKIKHTVKRVRKEPPKKE